MDAFIVGANVDFEGAHQGKIGKVEGIDLRNVREVCHLIVQGQVDIALVVLHTNRHSRLEANGLHLGTRSTGKNGA